MVWYSMDWCGMNSLWYHTIQRRGLTSIHKNLWSRLGSESWLTCWDHRSLDGRTRGSFYATSVNSMNVVANTFFGRRMNSTWTLALALDSEHDIKKHSLRALSYHMPKQQLHNFKIRCSKSSGAIFPTTGQCKIVEPSSSHNSYCHSIGCKVFL